MLSRWERPGTALADLLLRLEQDGEVLGEWRLGDPPLRLSVVDRETGRVVATLAAEVPAGDPTSLRDFDTAVRELPTGLAADAVPQVDGEKTLELVDELLEDAALEESSGLYHEPTAELPVLDTALEPFAGTAVARGPLIPHGNNGLGVPLHELHRVDPDRLDHSTTQDAPAFGSEDTASAPLLLPDSVLESVTARGEDLLREPTESLPELGLDGRADVPELTLDPYTPAPASHGVDEVPMDPDDPGPLARHPGDDFTLPLPVSASEHTATGAVEETGAVPLVAQEAHEGNLTDDLIELEGRAEVWSRRSGEWVLKGSLVPGQRARMKEGSVKCLHDGGLLVTPGPVMRGTVDVPGADQVTMKPGEEPRRFPAGAAVTLWSGDRALYVRSDQVMLDVAPVEYHSGRTQAVAGYRPPRSDLESTGHGEL